MRVCAVPGAFVMQGTQGTTHAA